MQNGCVSLLWTESLLNENNAVDKIIIRNEKNRHF